VIVLPGPVVLADPLPDGWRRCHALGCGAPAGHDGAHVPASAYRAAAAPRPAGACELCDRPAVRGGVGPAAPRCPVHAPPTRAERIEAAARVFIDAQDAFDALDGGCGWNAFVAAAWRKRGTSLRALRAALCSCTGHGPDLACVEHGAAIRAWQKENGT